MSEFFLELFSEEIPSSLQNSSRTILLDSFQKLFDFQLNYENEIIRKQKKCIIFNSK